MKDNAKTSCEKIGYNLPWRAYADSQKKQHCAFRVHRRLAPRWQRAETRSTEEEKKKKRQGALSSFTCWECASHWAHSHEQKHLERNTGEKRGHLQLEEQGSTPTQNGFGGPGAEIILLGLPQHGRDLLQLLHQHLGVQRPGSKGSLLAHETPSILQLRGRISVSVEEVFEYTARYKAQLEERWRRGKAKSLVFAFVHSCAETLSDPTRRDIKALFRDLKSQTGCHPTVALTHAHTEMNLSEITHFFHAAGAQHIMAFRSLRAGARQEVEKEDLQRFLDTCLRRGLQEEGASVGEEPRSG
ncbi:uncharacterized protein LOC115094697 [Rhinatrema bivittatum]|uniref:uncharacterized protein LOC115094697 n=1 Tax=Rhinatrema bivittatum TaxID=194408 RepID=UPI0011294378|nr:uncharacterized protein LOC115094697 [Rhinatrema bivittatum]